VVKRNGESEFLVAIVALNKPTIRFITYFYPCRKQESTTEDSSMRGARILIVFFRTFTVVSISIPQPIFPESLFAALIGGFIQDT